MCSAEIDKTVEVIQRLLISICFHTGIVISGGWIIKGWETCLIHERKHPGTVGGYSTGLAHIRMTYNPPSWVFKKQILKGWKSLLALIAKPRYHLCIELADGFPPNPRPGIESTLWKPPLTFPVEKVCYPTI
jgi:hypothetical protein